LAPLGALIGLAVHLANTAPDIEADARAGVRGMAHRLGERASLAVAWSAFAAALALTLVLAPALDYDLRWYAPVLAIGGAALSAGLALMAARPRLAAELSFPLLAAAGAAASVGWLAAVA
jgi:4-hydroxybenzoate polyprenyltransferase